MVIYSTAMAEACNSALYISSGKALVYKPHRPSAFPVSRQASRRTSVPTFRRAQSPSAPGTKTKTKTKTCPTARNKSWPSRHVQSASAARTADSTSMYLQSRARRARYTPGFKTARSEAHAPKRGTGWLDCTPLTLWQACSTDPSQVPGRRGQSGIWSARPGRQRRAMPLVSSTFQAALPSRPVPSRPVPPSHVPSQSGRQRPFPTAAAATHPCRCPCCPGSCRCLR